MGRNATRPKNVTIYKIKLHLEKQTLNEAGELLSTESLDDQVTPEEAGTFPENELHLAMSAMIEISKQYNIDFRSKKTQTIKSKKQ